MLFGFVIKSVSFKMLDLWLKFIQSILFPLTQFCHTILVHAHPKFSLSLGLSLNVSLWPAPALSKWIVRTKGDVYMSDESDF